MKLDKPILDGKTDSENIARLETWASNLTQKVEYELNHLDSTNFVEEPLNRAEVQQSMDAQYEELRSYIVAKIKAISITLNELREEINNLKGE